MTTVATHPGLTIAEAAAASGLSVHTLRYYERDGLMLDPVDRAPSGHRRYTEGDLGWIALVNRLRATGMPVREVRAYADLVRAGDGNEAQRLELLRAHHERVLVEMESVRAHLVAIERKIDVYEGRAASCVEP
ncbi:MerR family transcriptional regulator [Cellulosimicrobium arenosum]|uniref:MerR family transcriptional regulator n=1 Tax=Cellulosimicrobium arenosum TaxID=2708133 RepID=A0A927G905_9MICO|nr:MerR family transcriptional regulator [Cellulosimicrobium arenosum]MBD8078540.1 MerR family transcriptional regulator [Cellulosimicrobium arenosum]